MGQQLLERAAGLNSGVGIGARTFTNPLYTGADPWVVRRGGVYYYCGSNRHGQIEVWRSHTLTERGVRAVVWSPPRRGWNCDQVWAPELHFVGGRWHIYYAASDGENRNHRMGVLVGGDDPQGRYVDGGQLYTGDNVVGGGKNRWAIDGTVMELGGKMYFLWSGWEGSRDVQHLYVAPMSDPCTVAGDRVRVCANDDYLWERVGERRSERGLNEGPQVMVRGGRVFLVYSASGSWQHTYKLGMLWMDAGADPLNAGSWQKVSRPVFEATGEVFGVGHCSFTTSPDGSEDWIVYHAKRTRREGWGDRVVRAQLFRWTEDGMPDFGRPVGGTVMACPAGEEAPVLPRAA